MVSLTMGNSALPFADGGVRDEQALGKFLLGQAQFLAPLADEAAECFFVFHDHTLLCLDVPCKTMVSMGTEGEKVKTRGAFFVSTVGKVLGAQGVSQEARCCRPIESARAGPHETVLLSRCFWVRRVPAGSPWILKKNFLFSSQEAKK